jgi:hypothetical protein
MARFYSNENMSIPVVAELRTLGHKVLTSAEAGNANLGGSLKYLSTGPVWRGLEDRDRGKDRSSAPPTPPYIRFRIRRFDWLC